MTLTRRIDRSAAPPEVSRPDPALVTDGDPVHTTWSIEEGEGPLAGLYCGMWQSTPGTWRIRYSEWEYVRIHAGHSILRGDDGSVTELRAGDAWTIHPGFAGTWQVIETTLKDYVIYERP